MKTSMVVLFVSFIATPIALEETASACSGICTPEFQEVCLFVDANFCGTAKKISLSGKYGVYYPTMSNNNPIANDSLSSFKVGEGASLTVCTDWDYDYCYTYGPGAEVSSLMSSSYPWKCDGSQGVLCNDWASSIMVESTSKDCSSPPPSNVCAFYTDWYYENQCSWLTIDDYMAAGSPGIHDNLISSIRCGADVQAYVYRDANYSGDSWLSPYTDAAEFSNGENDAITSIRVAAR